jgi:hypothetical protein
MRRAAIVALLLLPSCGKKTGGASDAAVSMASASAAPVASSLSAPPSADAGSGTSAGTSTSASYAGSYTLAPGVLHIPDSKDYAHVKQAKDDPSKLVGPGTLALSVAGDGRVTGEVETGPAAPALISGTVVEGEIRGFVRRKMPSDDGLTGTIAVKIAGSRGEGTLTLAEANASILREGNVTLTAKK